MTIDFGPHFWTPENQDFCGYYNLLALSRVVSGLLEMVLWWFWGRRLGLCRDPSGIVPGSFGGRSGLFDVVLGHFGVVQERSGVLLEHTGGRSGAFWSRSGAFRDRSGAFWSVLGAFWNILKAFWTILGRSRSF